jgi:hypothetical protein
MRRDPTFKAQKLGKDEANQAVAELWRQLSPEEKAVYFPRLPQEEEEVEAREEEAAPAAVPVVEEGVDSLELPDLNNNNVCWTMEELRAMERDMDLDFWSCLLDKN